MINNCEEFRIEWEWDKCASTGYNLVARFEATLMNLDLLNDYSDIEDTEVFDKKYGNTCPNQGIRISDGIKRFDQSVEFFPTRGEDNDGSCRK